jgi:DNA polymerase III delta subunit
MKKVAVRRPMQEGQRQNVISDYARLVLTKDYKAAHDYRDKLNMTSEEMDSAKVLIEQVRTFAAFTPMQRKSDGSEKISDVLEQ